MSKALLIKSYQDKIGGTLGAWNDFNDASSYIQGIQISNLDDNVSADKIAALISGVPTPWARAKLFKFALDTLAHPDPNLGKMSGLTDFYTILHGEWRGLIAMLALHSDRIRVSEAVYMDTKSQSDYDIASAFGRMLFDDDDLWCNQNDRTKNPDAQPYIRLIYYKDQLVGGTSPFTGCFTGVNYSGLNGMSDISWYRNGKFEDPMRYLTPDETQKLYLFVKNMNSHLKEFETKINTFRNNNKVELIGFKTLSRQWEDEIRKKGGPSLHEKGPVACYENLECPFSVLLESNVPVYLKPDLTFTYTNTGSYREIGDIQNLLSRDNYVVGWVEDGRGSRSLKDAPVHLLRVNDIKTGSAFFFSVPLSEIGIDIYKNRLSDVLNNGQITGEINGGKLSVQMTVEIDNERVSLNTREYEIDWIQGQNRVIMWPDFVSDNWNRYYLYNEYTSESKEKFLPLFRYEGELLRTPRKQFLTSAYDYQPGEEPLVNFSQLIEYPTGLSNEMPKYNILMADRPFAGLSVMVRGMGGDEHAGFLMLRSDCVEDLTEREMQGEAAVGIDFGSNNTCLYYNAGHGPMPVEFANNRAVLVGMEHIDTRACAANDELLFFTNYPAQNGQLKSWLHEHDSRYNKNSSRDEVSGGVPVNRPNVYVRKMDEYEITTQAGKLHYNMKWLNNESGLTKKGAYLKSVWLQTTAFLYKKRLKPSEISWSHPGAMIEADVNDLERIFEGMKAITPYRCNLRMNTDRPTEAEAVCSFALSQDFGLTGSNMFLGIDVGGSTSDIMLIAKDPQNGNRETLYRESSVRLASGVFFNAVIRSEQFREALMRYHESNQRSVYVADIKGLREDPTKAPYYLNSIFDQLRGQDYDNFYNSLFSDAKFAFTIPAYVSGLLLYYSGMLIGKTIKEHNLTNIRQVDVLSFGKGGRIFHWLRSAGESVCYRYYEECLRAGVAVVAGDVELKVKYRAEIAVDNKAEVAKGLCDPQDVVKFETTGKSDICGETGVKFRMSDDTVRTLAVDEDLTGNFFDNNMNNFDFTDVSNFKAFMHIFIDFVGPKTRIYNSAEKDLCDALDDLAGRIQNVCTKDPEYRKAKEQKVFSYHQPIIIAEGLGFLSTLISKAFNQ